MMKKSDYILSFLYPVTVEVTNSCWNPVLEVVLYARKYLLNSENTNYFHGSLHALFKKIFRRIKFNWNEINNVLILGFGTGSVAEIIAKYKQDCVIDGVEIDNKVIEIGEKYFQTKSLKNVTINCASAEKYLENCQKKFDLIIIDVYLDINVPEELEKEEFLIWVRNSLTNGGMVIFNKFINSKTSRNQIPLLKELYKKNFQKFRDNDNYEHRENLYFNKFTMNNLDYSILNSTDLQRFDTTREDYFDNVELSVLY